jgi:hypothetical protein
MQQDRVDKGKIAMLLLFKQLHKWDIRKDPHMINWLVTSLVEPVLTFGSGLWGPYCCRELMKSDIDKSILKFWRSYWGLPKAAPIGPLIEELEVTPAAAHVLCQGCSLWPQLVQLPEGHFIHAMLDEDISMVHSWGHRFRGWLSERGEPAMVTAVTHRAPIECTLETAGQDCREDILFQYEEMLGGFDPRDTANPHRRISTYYCWSQGYKVDLKHRLSRWSWKQNRGWMSLRLGASRLRINEHELPVEQRICTHCEGGLHDLRHVLFECPITSVEVTQFMLEGGVVDRSFNHWWGLWLNRPQRALDLCIKFGLLTDEDR